MKKSRKIVLFVIIIMLYTLLIISICLIYENKKTVDIENAKKDKIYALYELYKKQNISQLDKIIAFGPQNATSYGNAINLEKIKKSKIISQENINLLKEEFDIAEVVENVYTFLVYCGTKDNKDYICFFINDTGSKAYFLCESNLEYSFASIIDEFDSEYCIEISDNDLGKSDYDSSYNLRSGIIMDFIKDGDNYNISYIYMSNGKAYVINKNS